MKPYVFDWGEVEDIEDFLIGVEESLHIKFEENELAHVKTFDEFIDAIVNKLYQEDNDTCTSQQAFYKLKRKIAALGIYDVKNLRPNTELSEIFPSKYKNGRALEKIIGVSLAIEHNNMGPSKIAINVLNVLLAVSVLALLGTKLWFMALGIPVAIAGYYIALRYAKECPMHTVRDLVGRIVTYNYMSCRSDKRTINRKEIRNILVEIFSKGLYIEKEELLTARFTRE